jgi:hypothetical protein
MIDFIDEDDDAKKLKESQQEYKIRRRREIDDARWVLSNVKGRRFLWRMWCLCGTFQASYTAKDATQTAFNEGKRDIGIAILQEINAADIKAFSRMQDEVLGELKAKQKEENL